MEAATISEITQQHVLILQQMQMVWAALIAIAVFVLLFMAVMFGLAAWSVNRVNKRQGDLEAKFNLLIDVLLQFVKNRELPG